MLTFAKKALSYIQVINSKKYEKIPTKQLKGVGLSL